MYENIRFIIDSNMKNLEESRRVTRAGMCWNIRVGIHNKGFDDSKTIVFLKVYLSGMSHNGNDTSRKRCHLHNRKIVDHI